LYSGRVSAAAAHANEACSLIEKVERRRTLRVQARRKFSNLNSLAVKRVVGLGGEAHVHPEHVIVGGLR
jgi:adenylyl- and sulfurtransferase ThiI